ncbi:MAG: hypothetical protein ACRD22_17530 [Terriglobia bacterium]
MEGHARRGQVLTQVGGYYTQYYSMIETIFDPGNATSSAGANIPFSIIKGIEASMQSRVGRFGFDVSAALNKSILGPLVDAETYRFPTDYRITNQCAAGQVPNATNSNCTTNQYISSFM